MDKQSAAPFLMERNCILQSYHNIKALGSVMEIYIDVAVSIQDPVICRVEKFNQKCLHFMDRSGWTRINEDDHYVTFEITDKANHIFKRHSSKRYCNKRAQPQEQAQNQ